MKRFFSILIFIPSEPLCQLRFYRNQHILRTIFHPMLYTSPHHLSFKTKFPSSNIWIFTFQLYHATFILSAHSLNYSGNIFTLDELREEFQERILFGFLEGIWSLDIIYQGQRPVLAINENLHDDEVSEENNNHASDDQENYKRDLFAMLEDVIEMSSEYPSVLIDPEFSIINHVK